MILQANPKSDLSYMDAAVEPHEGHTDIEVIAELNHYGAIKAIVLHPGYISVRANRECLEKIQDIADVQIKATHQMSLNVGKY